jgi:hypothetical protein
MIYSPERKNNSYTTILVYVSLIIILCSKQIVFSLCWPLILLHHVPNMFLLVSCHVSPISARFQLTLFPKTGWAWPCVCPLPQTGSRKLWIQTTACFLSGTVPLYLTDRVGSAGKKWPTIPWVGGVLLCLTDHIQGYRLLTFTVLKHVPFFLVCTAL